MTDPHEQFMRQALDQAHRALEAGEVPIGCIIVHENRVIGKGHNQRESLQDPTAHAEIIAITAAAAYLKSWRLEKTALYVTLEPCAMCAGAIVLARIPNVYFGAFDPKAGMCGSLMNLIQDERLNHRPNVDTGLLQEECSSLLSGFFQAIRANKRAQQ